MDADEIKKLLAEISAFFDDATKIFSSSFVAHRSDRKNEERWIGIGHLEGRVVAVIFTRRDNAIRIISARRARKHEERAYRHEVAERPAQGQD